MLTIDNALGPLFMLIIIGMALGKFNYPGGDFWPRTEKLIYYLLFPALLVHILANADMRHVQVANLAIVCLGATFAVASGMWFARQHLARNSAAFTSVFQGGIRFNSYVAIAGAVALHGQRGATVSAVVLALLVPAVNLLSVACFELTGQTQRSIPQSIATIFRNPLILACLIGIALNLTGIGLPGWSNRILALVSRPALPLALIAVGVALRLDRLHQSFHALWWPSLIKLGVLPVLALGLAYWVGLDPVSRDVVLLFTACSTATSAYILSRQLGGDSQLMATLITAQTLLAMLTLPLWLVSAG